jgi:hypothetical protein
MMFGAPFVQSDELLVSRKLIAQFNTFAMLHADEQVYSHRPDFEWLDESRICQRDWRRFDKEKIIVGLPFPSAI